MPNKLFKVAPQQEVPPVQEPATQLEPDYMPHYNAWKQDPSPKTMGGLLNAIKPVLSSALRTYTNKPGPTLQSQAKILAADALEKYDPTKGKLKTHLMYHLQGLRRIGTQESQIVHLPERVGLDLYHLKQSEAELSDRLGRDPSIGELSDHVNLSKNRIKYIRQAQPGLPEGMMGGQGEAGEEQASVGPAVQMPENERIWHDYVYHDLQPIDQVIMEHTLGMYGRPVLPKKMIAQKLRMSPGAVTQRAAKIQEKLDKREELSAFF